MELRAFYEKVFDEIINQVLEECYIKEGLDKYLIRESYGKFNVALGLNPSVPVNIKFVDIELFIIDSVTEMDAKSDSSYLEEGKAKEIVRTYIKEYLNDFIQKQRKKFRLR